MFLPKWQKNREGEEEGVNRGHVFEEDEEKLSEVQSHSGTEVRKRRSEADRLLPEGGEGS